MHTLFAEMLSVILKTKTTILYLLCIMVGVLITGFTVRYFHLQSPILQAQIKVVTEYFTHLVFYWVLGFPYMLWIIYFGTDLMEREKRLGTLVLLLSKPITRTSIFLAKYFALLLSAVLLGMGSLLLAIMTISVSTNTDSEILMELLKMLPDFSIYLFTFTLCLGSLAAAFPLLCKTRRESCKLLFLISLIYIALPPLIQYTFNLYELPGLSFLPYYSWGLTIISVILSLGVILRAVRQFNKIDIYS